MSGWRSERLGTCGAAGRVLAKLRLTGAIVEHMAAASSHVRALEG